MAIDISDLEEKYGGATVATDISDLMAKYGDTPMTPQMAGKLPETDISDLMVKYGEDGVPQPTDDISDLMAKYPEKRGVTLHPALTPPGGIKEVKEPTTVMGTVGREAAMEALPTGAAIGGGWAAATASLPLAAALAPATAGISTVAVPLIAGLAGAIGAGWLAQKGQALGLEKIIGPEKFSELQATREQAAQEHPVASFVGGFAPAVATLGFNPRNVIRASNDAARLIKLGRGAKDFIGTPDGAKAINNLINVSVGSGTQAGQEIYNQVQQGEFQPIRLMATIVVGAMMNDPVWSKKMPRTLRRFAQEPQVKAAIEDISSLRGARAVEEPAPPLTQEEPRPTPPSVEEPIITPLPQETPSPTEGIPLGKVSVDRTMVQALVDEGASLKDAIEAVRDLQNEPTPISPPPPTGEAKPPEQMTPMERKGRIASIQPEYIGMKVTKNPQGYKVADVAEGIHASEVSDALDRNRPVSAAAVDQYGIKLPEGYVREGKQFIYKPPVSTEAITPAGEAATAPALQAERPAEKPITEAGAKIAEPQTAEESWNKLHPELSYQRALELEKTTEYPRRDTALFRFNELTPEEQQAVLTDQRNELVVAKNATKEAFAQSRGKAKLVKGTFAEGSTMDKHKQALRYERLVAERLKTLEAKAKSTFMTKDIDDAFASGKIDEPTWKNERYVQDVMAKKFGLDVDVRHINERVVFDPNNAEHVNTLRKGLVPDEVINEARRTGCTIEIAGRNTINQRPISTGQSRRHSIDIFLGGYDRTAIHELIELSHKIKGAGEEAHRLALRDTEAFFNDPPYDYRNFQPSRPTAPPTGEPTFAAEIRAGPPTTAESAAFDAAHADNQAKLKVRFDLTPERLRDKMAAAFRDVSRPFQRRLQTAGEQGNALDMAMDRVRGSTPIADMRTQDTMTAVKKVAPDLTRDDIDKFRNARHILEVDVVTQRRYAEAQAKVVEAQRAVDALPEGVSYPERHKAMTALETAKTELKSTPKEHLQGDFTPENARAYLADIQNRYGPERAARLEAAANLHDAAMLENLDRMQAEGLITPEVRNQLATDYPHYSRLEFIQHIDPLGEGYNPATGTRSSVPDSGIEYLAGGSKDAMLTNSNYLLGQANARVESRIAKNRANRELAKLAEDPNNPLGAMPWNPNKPVPGRYAAISYMENGVQKQVLLPDEIARYYATTDPTINSKVVKIMGHVSGANLVRALATGLNPEFAWRNFFMDGAYTWFRTEEYSPWLPVAFGQRVSDLLKVSKDAWTFGPKMRAWTEQGGSQDMLTQYGSLIGKAWEVPGKHAETISKVHGFFAKLNSWSESTSRLASRERFIENRVEEVRKAGNTVNAKDMQDIEQRASLFARNIIDYVKGGYAIKAIDRFGVPYLSAVFRATDGLAQSLHNNPALFAFKLGQLAVLASGMTYWANKTSPKTMDSINDREKEGYWIVPLGDLAVTDAKGNPKYLYLKFRKDQTGRALAAMAETFTERMMGKKVDGARIRMGLVDAAPADLSALQWPLAAAMISYATNKNLWTNENIWRGTEVSPHLEYYNSTPDAYVAAADTLAKAGMEISPERLRQAKTRVFPMNAWTSMMGGMIDAMIPNDKLARKEVAERVISMPGVRAILGTTNEFDLSREELRTARRLNIPMTYPNGSARPSAQIKNELHDATVGENDRRKIQNDALDMMISKVRTKEIEISTVIDWITMLDSPADKKRLAERLKSKYLPPSIKETMMRNLE